MHGSIAMISSWPLRAALVVAVLFAVVIALAPVAEGWGAPLVMRDASLASRALGRGAALALVIAACSAVLAWPVAQAMPPLALLAWAMLGPLPRALGAIAMGLPPGAAAIVLAGVCGGVPWIALLLQLRWRSIDAGLLDAARNLGATRWQRWRRVVWPQSRGTLAFGALWIALQSSGDTATAEIAGGGKVYSAALLLRDAALVDDAPGLTAMLLLGLFVTAAPVTWWVARRLPDLVLAAQSSAEVVRSGPALGLGLALLAASPLLAVLPEVITPWSASDALIASRIGASLGVAAAVLAIALPLGAAAAIGAARGSPWIIAAILLPLVIPPVVYGLAALDVARLLGVAPGPAFTVLGSVPIAVALTFVATTIARPRVPPGLVEAAANLGASPWSRLWRLWLGRMGSAWLAAALLVVAWCWSDAMIAPFTSGPGDGTVAVAMTLATRGADADAASRWAWVQIVVTIATVLGAGRLWRRAGARR